MRRPKHFALLVLLSAFVLIAVSYSVVIPLGESPDEVSHFAYVQSLAIDRRLPLGDGPASGQAHQGPLYYLLGAALVLPVPNPDLTFISNPDWALDDPATPNVLLHTRQEGFPYQGGALAWHLVRLLSVALSAFTVASTYFLSKEVFPDDDKIAILAASFIAFLPQFGFISGMANNDSLIIALTCLAFLFFLHAWKATSFRASAILGLLLGLALLTKLTAVALWAAIALAIALGLNGGRLRERITSLVVVFAAAGLVVAPWTLYNVVEFGDPLTWSRLLTLVPRVTPLTVQDWELYAQRMFESFWGKFGGATHLGFPPLAYVALAGLLLLAAGGVALLVNDWRNGKPLRVNRNALAILLLFESILFLAHLRLYIAEYGADQARQAFSGLPFFGILFAAGLDRLTSHSARLNYAFIGVFLLTSVAGMLFAGSLYAFPIEKQEISTFAPPAVDFGNKIRMVSYHVNPASISTGNAIEVDIQWQALDDVKEDYWVLFRLVDEQGNAPVTKDSVPSAGRLTTDWWLKGETFSSRHTIYIPPGLASGTYKLEMGVHPFKSWEWLSAQGQDAITLDKIQVQ